MKITDKMRLDWLGDVNSSAINFKFSPQIQGGVYVWKDEGFYYKSLRQAIDAAMKADTSEGEEG